MKILGLAVPKGQCLFFYNCGGECGTLLFAKDYEDAYKKAMQMRLNDTPNPDADDVENAQRWFSDNDTLEEVVAQYTGPAYAGELSDDEDDECGDDSE